MCSFGDMIFWSIPVILMAIYPLDLQFFFPLAGFLSFLIVLFDDNGITYELMQGGLLC